MVILFLYKNQQSSSEIMWHIIENKKGNEAIQQDIAKLCDSLLLNVGDIKSSQVFEK